jgi:GGDEF domain-containing protein
MNTLAIGLWGVFFGLVTSMLCGAYWAYSQSLMRIAFIAALTAVVSAFFVLAFLAGLTGYEPEFLARQFAHLQALTSALMVDLFLSLKDPSYTPAQRHRARMGLALLTLLVIALGWWLTPDWALMLSGASASVLLFSVIFLALFARQSSDSNAKLLCSSLFFYLLCLVGMTWLTVNQAALPAALPTFSALNAMIALMATLCLLCIAAVLLARYFSLIDLRRVMRYGSAYDPVTQMRSPKQTNFLVDEIFKQFQFQPAPMGIIVLSIGNLLSLKKLYGKAAVNHALFVFAQRLKRCVPDSVEMGRLAADSFALIMPNCYNSGQLISLAQLLIHQLRLNIDLKTNTQASQIESSGNPWIADVGMGLLLISNPAVRGASAIAMARGMSHSAASYASRIAWFDHGSAQIVELSESYNPSSI